MNNKEFWTDFHIMRGIESVSVCEKCNGTGKRAYGNTTTWRGGIGGNMITGGVCDNCWGSGDKTNKWANLREMEILIKQKKDIGLIIFLDGYDCVYYAIDIKKFDDFKNYHPKKENGDFDSCMWQENIGSYLFKDGDPNPYHVLIYWTTQNYCIENLELNKYNIKGIITLPG